MQPLPRREFGRRLLLGSALVGLRSPLAAVEPFVRPGHAKLRLALAAYSFRDDGQKGKDAFLAGMDMFKFIDFCAAHGCDGAELTSYYFPPNVTDDYLAQVRRHAHLHGVSISGTAVGNDFGHPPGAERERQIAAVKSWIAKAAVLGAPHIRVFAGTAHGKPLAQAKRHCIDALEECAQVAGRHGIFLGIENHGGIVAEAADLIDIVRSVKSPWLGINLDSGNFNTEDPYADLARCAPWAVNVQFKGKLTRRGGKTETADFPRTFKILRDANYQGWVALEYELAEDPHVRVPQLLKQMREFMG